MNKKFFYKSNRWLREHFKDIYVKKAHKYHLRSRAWFKLHQIDKKYSLFRKGMNVVDLGASPGSWSQYAINRVEKSGCVISFDRNKMNPIPGVLFFQLNVLEKKKIYYILNSIKKKKIDVVMSDMSPNITGISYIDIPKSLVLCKLAFKISKKILSKNGIFLVKVFQNMELTTFISKLRMHFSIVNICKPHASRSCSREIFILAKDLKTIL